MNKINYFNKKLDELFKLTKMKQEIHVKQDNRLGDYIAHVELHICKGCDKEMYLFRYNAKEIKKASKIEIINTILHEFGHIKIKCGQNISRVENEYRAEKYAIKTIKKYYPQYYKQAVKNLKGYLRHVDKVYNKAFGRLYKELCKDSI